MGAIAAPVEGGVRQFPLAGLEGPVVALQMIAVDVVFVSNFPMVVILSLGVGAGAGEHKQQQRCSY